jgi:hypothetical protein
MAVVGTGVSMLVGGLFLCSASAYDLLNPDWREQEIFQRNRWLAPLLIKAQTWPGLEGRRLFDREASDVLNDVGIFLVGLLILVVWFFVFVLS